MELHFCRSRKNLEYFSKYSQISNKFMDKIVVDLYKTQCYNIIKHIEREREYEKSYKIGSSLAQHKA